jgi:hypothetical protein
MKVETVCLDMDGVIKNWTKSVCKIFDVDPNDPQAREILKSDLRIEEHLVPGLTSVEFKRILEEIGYDFWYNLEQFPWTQRLLDTIVTAVGKNNLEFLTSPGSFSQSFAPKFDYVKNVLGFDRQITITVNKFRLAKPNTLLIDDMFYNIDSFKEHGGQVFHWPNSYKLEDGDIDIENTFNELEQMLGLVKV